MKKILLIALAALVGFVACEPEPDTTPKQTLTLSVDNTEIYANGTQTATFTVKDGEGAVVEDATIYFASTNEALASNRFTTSFAGTYEFYAMKGNTKSNTVSVVAKEVTEDTKVVTLSVVFHDDYAFVGDTISFAVDCNGEDVTSNSVIYNAADNSALEGNTFTTDVPIEYSFYAIYEGEKSNTVTFQFVTTDTPPVHLSVSPATIVADGVEKAIFTINAELEFEVYNAADDSKLSSKEFSTTEHGVYTFYAICNDEKTNTVEVTARMKINDEPKPIEIEASTYTIKANGVDYTKFTVTEDGANVTDAVTIYVNGGKLNGNRFVTTTPGTYTVYAEKGSVKSNEITITAEEVTATGKSIVFADGVTLTSGWYDVNKVGRGDNGDIQMCWAASASNIIQWWQDRYVAMGGTLPSTAVTGPGKDGTYELALMDMYHSEWDNTYGGFVFHAIPWYFEGKNVCANWSWQAQPKTGFDGGYFKSAWDSSLVYNGYADFGYTSDCNGYYNWGNGTSLEGTDRLKVFSDYIVEFIDRGMVSLTISLADDISTLHHATTLWGYEIDNATGLLTRVWLTDSDDLESEPKGQILHEYKVSIGSGKSHVQLTSSEVRYGSVWVVGIIPVSGPYSAE